MSRNLRKKNIKQRNGQRKISGRRAVSLIEIIVVVALIAGFVVILIDIFLAHGKIFNTETLETDLHLQGNQTLNIVGSILRSARQIISDKTVNGQNYHTSPETLILELPSIDSGGKIIAGSYDYAVFYRDPLDGKRLMLSQEADPISRRNSWTKLLSDLAGGIKFFYDSGDYKQAGSVLTELNLSKSILGKTQSIFLSAKFNLGNR